MFAYQEERNCCKKHEATGLLSIDVSTVLECVEALLYYPDSSDGAKAIFQECKKLIGATAGYVALLDETGLYSIVLFLDEGGEKGNVDVSLPLPVHGLRARVYETGNTIYENDFAASDLARHLPKGHIHIKNIMFIPLIHGDCVIGLLGLGNKPGGFTESDVETGTAFGRFASVALNNKQIMARLTESEEKYRRLVEFIPEAIFVGCGAQIAFANSAAIALLGAKHPEEVVGKKALGFIHPDDSPLVKVAMSPIEKECLQPTIEARVIRLDGGIIDVELMSTAVLLNDEQATLVVARDITQRKQLEQESLNATKLEAVSILAGGIAHDFNNLLTVVLGNLSIAKMYAAKDSNVLTKLAEIENAALQTKDLTHQLLAFAKGQTLQTKVVHIKELLGESIPFLLRGTNCKVKFSFAEPLPPVEIDSTQISQVINNLVINAMQAMPDGGTITVKTDLAGDQLQGAVLTGRYIKMTVTDEGAGIAAENMARIFEPFFTTKADGNGLGLATSYNIVRNHGGHITVDSAVGGGTTFTIYLPASANPAAEEEHNSEELLAGRGKVLVMDDDEGVRKTLTEMLGILGFEVECAATGEEAVFLYQLEQDRGGCFSFVILDMTVRGGMGGVRTIRELQAINPNVSTVVTSGYAGADLRQVGEVHGFKGFVSKPYKIEELSAVLKNIVQ